ncbi:MAG: hypothetical protein GY696_33940, partial [Gammaproteobacteria bacterium]|nr:hypothetical protein [Gammaproteobacteria bacterium]
MIKQNGRNPKLRGPNPLAGLSFPSFSRIARKLSETGSMAPFTARWPSENVFPTAPWMDLRVDQHQPVTLSGEKDGQSYPVATAEFIFDVVSPGIVAQTEEFSHDEVYYVALLEFMGEKLTPRQVNRHLGELTRVGLVCLFQNNNPEADCLDHAVWLMSGFRRNQKALAENLPTRVSDGPVHSSPRREPYMATATLTNMQ